MAAGIVASAASTGSHVTRDPQGRPELRALTRATGPSRPFAARLTGGFIYGAPTASETLDENGRTSPATTIDRRSSLSVEVQRELALIAAAAERDDASAPQLEARGIAALIDGRPVDAVTDIDMALMRLPARGDWWSDLAAAYLARAAARNTPDDVVRALDAARRAVEVAPTLPEARFNLALALDANHLLPSASLAWQRYLDVDGASSWAAEARTRQQAVDARRASTPATTGAGAATAVPCSSLEPWLWEDIVAQFARAVRADDRGADDGVDEARRRTTTCVGDRALFATVIERARRCRLDRRCAGVLASGLAGLAAGMRLEREDHLDRAGATFADAARRLDEARNPAALVAALHAGMASIRTDAVEEGRARVLEVARAAARDGHHGLAGQAWLQAVNATNGFERLDEVLVLSQQAFDAFSIAGDPILLASGHNLMATFLAVVGARERAWAHRLAALGLHARTPVDARRRLNNLMGAARMATREGLDGAAAAYQEAALLTVDAAEAVADRVEVRIALAQTLDRLGAAAHAVGVLEDVSTQSAVDIDPRIRAALDARLAAVQAALALPGDAPRAVERISAALTYHERVQDTRRLPELLLLRARAHLVGGDTTAARADLKQGAVLIERGVRAAGDDPTAYFEGVWRLYAELVRVDTILGGDARAGLIDAERILLDPQLRKRFDEGGAIPTDALAADEVVVRYLCLDDRWIAWVVDREGIQVSQSAVAQADLAYEVRRLVDLMERGGSDTHVRAALSRLHDWLIAPLPARVHRATRLVIVADGPLARVPFAALWDARRQRYLVEDHMITRARGALSLLVRRAREAGAGAAAGQSAPLPARALVIGNPTIDRDWWSGLPSLPTSADEARTIGRLYPRANVLVGDEATPAQVRRLIADAEIVHFAGHAVESSRWGDVSLVLAPDDRARPASGALSMSALLARGDVRPRVIVLAACRSGTGPERRASGVTGMPEQLLGRGVEAVVASLWDVEDVSTQRLMSAFHGAIAAGVQPSEALRRAQLAFVSENDASLRRPSAWAAFSIASAR